MRPARSRALALLAGTALLAAAHTASAKDLNSVGVSVGSLGNPYFLSLVEGAKEAAHAINPNAKVTAVSSEYDLGKQSGQIDSFISSGTDVILIAAADPKAIASSVARAQKAGIPVIAVDVAAQGADATVQTDNTAAGRISCAYLGEKVQKGNVIIQNGPQVSSIVERVKGCKESLAKYPGITILPDQQDGKVSRDGGLNVMMGELTRFPDVQGVFTVDDPQAIGSALAAKQLHRTGFIITSVDGSPDVANALKSGDSIIKATASQSPRDQGRQGVQIGYGLLNGKKPEKTVTLLEPQLVTHNNVGQYKGW